MERISKTSLSHAVKLPVLTLWAQPHILGHAWFSERNLILLFPAEPFLMPEKTCGEMRVVHETTRGQIPASILPAGLPAFLGWLM
jgi:Mlc titration factor MtfA (ptsG expression regulator)